MAICIDGYRLYAQCNGFLHIFDIKSEEKDKIIGEISTKSLNRDFFGISYDSLAFITSSSIKKNIDCWNLQAETKLDTIELPMQSKFSFISSITHHPLKKMLACTVYRDLKNCLYIMRYENKSRMTDTNDRRHSNGMSLKKFERKIIKEHTENSETFQSILSWLDNLFRLAINSPNRTDDYKQRKQIQITLDQLKFHNNY